MLRKVVSRYCNAVPVAAVVELRKLIPMLDSHERGRNPTSASLIVSTAHASTTTVSRYLHRDDCPVLAKKVSLPTIYSDAAFCAHPCTFCVRERVHHLASVLFCEDFQKKCFLSKPKGPLEESSIPISLMNELRQSYTSVAAFVKDVELFCINGLSFGRLWVVYAPSSQKRMDGYVTTINLPSYEVPLVHGLWPLAVINLSEDQLCNELNQLLHCSDASTVAPAPSWSHAARNPSTAITSEQEASESGRVNLYNLELTELRAKAAQRALECMNWQFVDQQLTAAITYYDSTARALAREEFRKSKERAAAMRAMSHLRDSGAVIYETDSVTVSSTPSAVVKGSEYDHSPGADNVGVGGWAAVSASTEKAAILSPETCIKTSSLEDILPTQQGVSATDADTSDSATVTTDPYTVEHPDGSWEYQYFNGNVTTVMADGTKIFKTKELTTTVFVNGDTLFTYPNHTSILDRADGIRVTTYADKSTKEERLR